MQRASANRSGSATSGRQRSWEDDRKTSSGSRQSRTFSPHLGHAPRNGEAASTSAATAIPTAATQSANRNPIAPLLAKSANRRSWPKCRLTIAGAATEASSRASACARASRASRLGSTAIAFRPQHATIPSVSDQRAPFWAFPARCGSRTRRRPRRPPPPASRRRPCRPASQCPPSPLRVVEVLELLPRRRGLRLAKLVVHVCCQPPGRRSGR
jgi:hypothetical protein